MPNVRELLERESTKVALEPGDFERLLRRRDRKERNRRFRAGTLAAAVFVVAASFFLREYRSQPTPADRPVRPLPIEDAEGPSPIEGSEFPMFPESARPSTPRTGAEVVRFRSWPLGGGFPMELAIYADGRVIWHPNQDDVGFFRLRLTPAGVDHIRSMIISTGLFNHDLDLIGNGELSRLTIQRDGRSVFVQWGDESWFEQAPKATPSQSRVLADLERFLGDPSAWQLSGDLFADLQIRHFVPSGFMFQYDIGEPDLSRLPSPARDLLARHDPESTECSFLTPEVARRIARALARAGFAPLENSPVYLDWNLPGSGGGRSNPHLTPALPNDVECMFSPSASTVG
jgi:hypothetical protein